MEFTASTFSDDWKTSALSWKRMIDRYQAHLLQQQSKTLPNSLLLYLCGTQLAVSFLALARDNPALTTFWRQFEDACLPRLIVLYERFKFFTRVQQPDEPVCKFISDLRGMLGVCQFQADDENKYVKERIVNGVCSERYQNMLRNASELDVYNMIELCYSVSQCDKEKCQRHVSTEAMENVRMPQSEETSEQGSLTLESTQDKSTTDSKEGSRTGTCDLGKQDSKQSDLRRSPNNNNNNNNNNMTSLKIKPSVKRKNPKSRARSLSHTGSKESVNSFVVLSCKQASAAHTHRYELVPDREKVISSSFKDDKSNIFGHMAHKTPGVVGDSFIVDLRRKEEEEEDVREENNEDRQLIPQKVLTFQCENCQMSFDGQTDLDQHQHSGCGPEGIRCDECGKFCPSSHKLHLHRRKEHRKGRYVCEFCDQSFPWPAGLKEHRMLKHKVTIQNKHSPSSVNMRYSCDLCEQAFPYRSKLKLHQMVKHNVARPYMCDVCGSSYPIPSALRNHMNIHTKEKEHECTLCGRRFLIKACLRSHLHTHLTEKPHMCEVCGKHFKLTSYLKSHLKTHETNRIKKRPCTCQTCGASFPHRTQLRDHELKHTGEKPFRCDLCPATFTRRSSMKQHVKLVHERRKPPDKFACEFCELKFPQPSLLKIHLRKHTGERPFVCRTCGAAYRQNCDLSNHMRVHQGNQPFRCHVCGRGYLKRSVLEDHIRTHTGEKPFTCSTCGGSFCRKSSLRIHQQIHAAHRERAYKCAACGKAFLTASHLRSHEKLHSGGRTSASGGQSFVGGCDVSKDAEVACSMERSPSAELRSPIHPDISVMESITLHTVL